VTANSWQPADPDLARLLDRLRQLEGTVHGWQEAEAAERTRHRARAWQVILAVLTGLVLPLLVIGTLALIHLIGN
jgi:hypothetical protein